MKKNAGIIALVTVALAFFGVSNIPWKGASGGSGAETSENAKKTVRTAKAKPEENKVCDDLVDRLKPFVNATGEWRLLDSCYKDASAAKSLPTGSTGAETRFLIATVPNPISTHLPLMFDRMIETIQSAAGDDSYSYHSSWFPWDSEKEYYLLDDQDRAEDARKAQQGQPGVMTFRGPMTDKGSADPFSSGLIVFVVAEQPTEGIDLGEFRTALEWIQRLRAKTAKRELRILGPTFSGSLPSLRKALSSRDLAELADPGAIKVYSGSVSSDDGFRWFQTFMSKEARLGEFKTFSEGDSVMIARFCRFIEKQGYSP